MHYRNPLPPGVILLHRELHGVEWLVLCFPEVFVMLSIFWIYSCNSESLNLLATSKGWHSSTIGIYLLCHSLDNTMNIILMKHFPLFASCLSEQRNYLLSNICTEPRFLSFQILHSCMLRAFEGQGMARSQHLSDKFYWVTPAQLSTVWRILTGIQHTLTFLSFQIWKIYIHLAKVKDRKESALV